MRAIDVMTRGVITATADTPIKRVAGLLAQYRISAVPVVDDDNRVIGMVSEGDLAHRVETGTERRRSWWLEMAASNRMRAAEFVKSHGTKASDVMTRDVIAVTEETPLADIAILLETHGVKRVPVLRSGHLVGIVSRADLVRALALSKEEPSRLATVDDQAIRDALVAKLKLHSWAEVTPAAFTVKDRVVHLWSNGASDEERQAFRVAAETVKGVLQIVEHPEPAAQAQG
jgi:CBS domain-containing protein